MKALIYLFILLFYTPIAPSDHRRPSALGSIETPAQEMIQFQIGDTVIQAKHVVDRKWKAEKIKHNAFFPLSFLIHHLFKKKNLLFVSLLIPPILPRLGVSPLSLCRG